MKTYKKYITQAISFLLLLFVILYGCKEDMTIGLEILPSGDLISVKNQVIKEDISAYTFTESHIRTDEPSNSLLGSFTDSLFGNTTIDFAAQYRLFEFPDFGKNPEVDSVKLYLYYRILYGDTVTPQRFKVYELNDRIYADKEDSTGNSFNYRYYQDDDLKSMASTNLLGEVDYTPRIRLDSATADTFYQLITVPIDNSLGEKLLDADSLQMVRADLFMDYFKGLYIETEKLNDQGGAILSLEASSSSVFQGSALALYFSNDSSRSFTTTDTSFVMPYIISQFSARINHIEHDYTSTPFYQNLNSELVKDSLIYVQSTGGLKSKIIIDDLTKWADTDGKKDTAINRAELIFQIDTTASQVTKFRPPEQLIFTYLDDAGGQHLPPDYLSSPTYYGGTLQDDYTYHFNITQLFQQIIEGEIENHGFFLETVNKNSQANRVVLKGSTSNTGIKLIITYSKITR